MHDANKAKFYLLRNVNVSFESQYEPIRKKYLPRLIITPATFAVTWPNGAPCTLIEIYLIFRYRRGASVREDGGSLRATTAKLIHLIRYCWIIKRDLWELDDEDIYGMVLSLMSEMKKSAPFIRARDNNTVRLIIAASVDFLLWIQNDIMVEKKIIGVGSEYKIKLIEKKILLPQRNRYIIQRVYHRLPPNDTKEPKRPISREKRNAIWQAVSNMANVTILLPIWGRSEKILAFLKEYLKARRELLLELLEATGARPGELARISVLKNEDCYEKQELILLTLKRRRHIERKIKLQPGVAMRLTVFIRKYRSELLKAMHAAGQKPDPMNLLFLGINGTPMNERSMVTEFSRISKVAGLAEYQSCMSMFRHRFITKQVAIHLGIYLNEKNKTKEMMTDGDYRTILKKVAVITGHGDENSLLHYIDMAWEELGVADQVGQAIAIDASIEMASTQVISLIGNLEIGNKKPTSKLLKETKIALENIQREIRTAIGKRN